MPVLLENITFKIAPKTAIFQSYKVRSIYNFVSVCTIKYCSYSPSFSCCSFMDLFIEQVQLLMAVKLKPKVLFFVLSTDRVNITNPKYYITLK